MAVESRVARPWPFGVNIDGVLVCDLDDWRVLANFDLYIPRRRWKTERAGEETPKIAPPGDLAFTPETVKTKSFDPDSDGWHFVGASG